jgi:hypothetical protein
MTLEMRKKLARESWEEKVQKVGMLIATVKAAPKLGKQKARTVQRTMRARG